MVDEECCAEEVSAAHVGAFYLKRIACQVQYVLHFQGHYFVPKVSMDGKLSEKGVF